MRVGQSAVFMGVLTGLACGGGGYGSSGSMNSTTTVSTLIQVHTGSGQSTAISTAFATALQATVLTQQVVDDGYGSHTTTSPKAGATVTFTIVAGVSGASGTFPGAATTAMATTDASGYATAPALTANGTAGAFTVTAVTAGGNGPATFSLTNL